MSRAAEIAVRTIDLTHTDAVSSLPVATSYAGAAACSSVGVLYTQPQRTIADGEGPGYGTVYSVSDQIATKEIKLVFPDKYKAVVPEALFAGEGKVVAMLRASRPKDPEEVLAPRQTVPFLSIADTDGGEPTLIRLQLPFQPTKAAIFESGKLLVLGVDTANLIPVLALLHEDGSLEEMFDLDPRVYQKSEELKKIPSGRRVDANSSTAQRVANRAMFSAEFVPWGKAILLVQRGTKLPVYRFTDAGTQDEIKVQLPAEQVLTRILGSGENDTWVVESRVSGSPIQAYSRGRQARGEDSYFEVDPETGTVIDRLDVEEPDNGTVACAANGKLSGIYREYKDEARETLEMTYASARR